MANNQQNNPEQELSSLVKDLTRRLRQIEERYSNIRKSMQVTEQNMISQSKKNTTDKKALQADIAELKKHIKNMGEEMKIVAKELGTSAKKEDVKLLEKYISFWDPLSFVTRRELQKEVKRLVKKEIEEYKNKKEQNQNI